MLPCAIDGFAVAPVAMNAQPDTTGAFAVTAGVSLNLPIFLDATGANSVLLPLSQARFTMGTLSASQNCIGSYNASGLTNSCADAVCFAGAFAASSVKIK